MAKMFYSIEEAAQRLGVSVDQVKQMAADGKLQQFRDRDKLMFKREQIDALSGGGREPSGGSGGPIPLADSGDTDAIDLNAEGKGPSSPEDGRSLTGISVFDAGEVEPVDPAAQTQVNQPADEELVLESVGSGSGLLDLTRESDDTSLGAELLDEIYPGSGEGSDAKQGGAAVEDAPTSSGVFETPSDIGSSGVALEAPPGSTEVPVSIAAEAYEPAWSGLAAGMFIGTAAALIIGMIVAISALAGQPNRITATFTEGPNSLVIYSLVLLVGCVVLGVVGFFVGNMGAKR